VKYTTKSGATYDFSGWRGEDPTTFFDRRDWLGCLHGCMLCLSLLGRENWTQMSIADDGLLHELVHLAAGSEICTHNSLDKMREEVVELQRSFEKLLEEAEL